MSVLAQSCRSLRRSGTAAIGGEAEESGTGLSAPAVTGGALAFGFNEIRRIDTVHVK
jgi:hypothetical protein